MDVNRSQEEYTSYSDDSFNNNDEEKSVENFLQRNKKSPKYLALINKKEVKVPLISTFDTVVSLIILTPCVVGFWRGAMGLMDIYYKYFPAWHSTLLGLSVHLLFSFTQEHVCDIVKKKSENKRKKILKMIVSRMYIFVFALTSIVHWRGAWLLIDQYLKVEVSATGSVMKKGSETLVYVTVGCFLVLIILRSLRNCISPPFVFFIDTKNSIFIIPTRFKTKMSERTSLYVLDCLFSVLVIGTLVVFVWRGAWALIDIFLFPENDVWSAWGSLIVGYSAVAVAFMLQPFMRWLCDRITGVARLLVADIFLILSLIGTINVWRGIWNLLNIYLLPDQLELSCWLTHWICLIVLILLGCSNSLLVRGVYIDAEEPAGKCVVFPCYYLRLIFQEQKLKQLHSEQTKTEMVTVKPFENNHIVNIQNANVQYPHTLDVNHKEGEV